MDNEKTISPNNTSKTNNARRVSKSDQADRVTDLLSGKTEDKSHEIENAADTADTDRKTETRQLDSADDRDNNADDNSDKSAAGEAEEKPLTLKDLADELNIDSRSLYDLAIPIGNGKTLSLGEIKDLAKTAEARGVELAALQAMETERSNEIMVARNELSTLVSALGERVPPAEREALLEMQGRHLARERQLMLAAIPAWRDPAVLQADRQTILDFAKTYGFNASEIAAVTDHRLVKLLRDTATGYAAARAASNKSKVLPQGMAPSNDQGKKPNSLRAALARAKAPGATRGDKIAGINALLSGKP